MRQPMTPDEFDRNRREFELRCPFASATSGARSAEHNEKVGGNPQSKHALVNAMAQDYSFPIERRTDATNAARDLGFWFKFYTWGIHLQGLPRGPLEPWWQEKYGGLRDV